MKKLLLILILGFLIRIFNLWQVPLYGDELTIVYDSFSLYQTGRDAMGEFLPITFSMGAGRPPGYVYGSIPFVALLGPNFLGVRALSLLSGLGIITLMYFLGKQFSPKIGLFAALTASLSPWEISLSRGGFEAHLALFLSLLGVYLLIARFKPYNLFISAICFGLAINTYPTFKLTLPLIIAYILSSKQTAKSLLSNRYLKYSLIFIAVLFSFALLAISQTFVGNSEQRFANINIFSDKGIQFKVIENINNERNMEDLPKNIIPIFHNKLIEYTVLFAEGYLRNLSTDFLFIHGDGNPRHNMAGVGQFYLIEAVLILLGGFYFFKQYRNQFFFLLFWILIAPLPAAFIGEPHALRASFLLPPLLLFGAAGIFVLSNLRKGIFPLTFKILCVLIFAVQFVFFLENIYFLAPDKHSSFWAYPAYLATNIISKERKKYDFILVSDRIDNVEYAYPVYQKIKPDLVIEQNKMRSPVLTYNFKKFDNVYIGAVTENEIEKFMAALPGKVLFIGIPEQGKYLTNLESINGKDNLPALVLKRKE